MQPYCNLINAKEREGREREGGRPFLIMGNSGRGRCLSDTPATGPLNSQQPGNVLTDGNAASGTSLINILYGRLSLFLGT